VLSPELKSQIQGAYSRFLEAKELKPRYGQRLMIAEVAKVLGAIKTDEEGRRLLRLLGMPFKQTGQAR